MKVVRRSSLVLLLILYLIVLTKVTLLKYYPIPEAFAQLQRFNLGNIKSGWEAANIIPFRTIIDYIFVSPVPVMVKIENMATDLIAFAPLGAILPLLSKRFLHITKVLTVALGISLGFELLQWIFKLGVFDLDHLIMNAVGSILGFFPMKLLHVLIESKQQRNLKKVRAF